MTDRERIEEKMRRYGGYIPVVDLLDRFIEVDEYYGHEAWDIDQIINNIDMIVPIQIPKKMLAELEREGLA